MNTIGEILTNTESTPIPYRFGCQVQSCLPKVTKSQKPYYELKLVDVKESIALKIWNNHAQFDNALSLKEGQFLLIEGAFTKNQYGLESSDWSWSPLTAEDKSTLLSGDPSLKERQSADFATIVRLTSEISDPRLRALCEKFLGDFGERFKRAAAAKKNHHARRGGLTEHVCQMMKSAVAISGVYEYLNKDLIVTAVLFHDCGKLWENNYPEEDFHQQYNLYAEALGHICLGIELVNKLWRDILTLEISAEWKTLSPSSDKVRIHLLHLVASHHGTLEFGSPVVPKTPEAYALHYIDNLDAKMEMCAMSYDKSALLAPDIYERQFPLSAGLLAPLEKQT